MIYWDCFDSSKKAQATSAKPNPDPDDVDGFFFGKGAITTLIFNYLFNCIWIHCDFVIVEILKMCRIAEVQLVYFSISKPSAEPRVTKFCYLFRSKSY